jgi:hypothetical protein
MGAGAGAGTWVLAALPFVVFGYLFIIAWPRTRYFSATADGQRLFFMCAAAGLLLAAVAYPAARLLDVRPVAAALEAAFGAHAGYAETLALALLFGVPIVILLRRYDGPPGSQTEGEEDAKWHQMFRHLARQHGSPLQRLLISAEQDERLIAVTLTSRKFYCGVVLKLSPAFRSDDQYIEIIPMFSATRDKDTLHVRHRIDYPVFDWWRATRRRDQLQVLLDKIKDFAPVPSERAVITESISKELDDVNERIGKVKGGLSEADLLARLSIRDWVKVIPLKLIESASIYDEAANRLWFSGRGDTQAEESAPPGTARSSGEASPPH